MNRKEMVAFYNRVVINYIIPVIILLGVSFVLFSQAVADRPQQEISFATFDALSDGVENYYDFRTPWKPRLFSTALAAYTVHVCEQILEKVSIPMAKDIRQLTLGIWTSGWFFLISLFFIVTLKKRSIFYIFGTFVGISFGYQVFYKTVIRIYSWDLPALLFFSLFVLLYIRKKYWWIFVLIPLGVGFKETVFILCFSFIFSDQPWRTRLAMTTGAFVISAVVKIGIDTYVHAPLFFTMETGMQNSILSELYILNNIHALKSLIPLLANTGLLVAFLVAPNLSAEIQSLKFISIPFILGTLIFGIVTEYRIWFEMIPISLYVIDTVVYGNPLKSYVPAILE